MNSGRVERYLDCSPNQWELYLAGLPGQLRRYAEACGGACQARHDGVLDEVARQYDRLRQIEDRATFAHTVKQEVPRAYQAFIFALRSGRNIDAMLRRYLGQQAQSMLEGMSPATA